MTAMCFDLWDSAGGNITKAKVDASVSPNTTRLYTLIYASILFCDVLSGIIILPATVATPCGFGLHPPRWQRQAEELLS